MPSTRSGFSLAIRLTPAGSRIRPSQSIGSSSALAVSSSTIENIARISLTKSFKNLATANVLDARTGQELTAAYRLQTVIQGLMRICFISDPQDEELSDEVKSLMTGLTGQPNFEMLCSRVEQLQTMVYSQYYRLLGREGDREEEK